MAHKNSDDSEELHHLYEIVDKIDYMVRYDGKKAYNQEQNKWKFCIFG